MDTVIKKMGNKGELVIPEKMRRSEGLEPKTKVRIFRTKGAIIVVPLNKKFRDFAGLFGKGRLNKDELEEAVFDLITAT